MRHVTYINAGAGSGKTYTLTKILAEKLTDKTAVIRPSEVILTTFTELAASEFREKARQKVIEVGNLDAAAQIDGAAIGTVHSVALRFIKKFWYLLSYGAEIQTISDRDEDFYLNQSLTRIVEEKEENGQLKHREALEAFRRFRDYYDISDGYSHPDYLFWQTLLKKIVEKMEYYEVTDVEESIQKSLEKARKIYIGPKDSQELKKELLDYLQRYYDYCGTKTTNTSTEHRTAIEPLLQHCETARQLTILISKIKSPVGGATKIEQNCPGFTDFKEKLQKLQVSVDDLDILEPFITSMFRLAKEWRDDYVAYKQRNHIISYNDMEQLFLHLITEEQEVKDFIKENYKLVMVDEFQDSNPIQLKIFNQLSELIGEAGGHSFWVGDPKQAIYGFRGADTSLVNAVTQNFKFYDDAEIHPEEGEHALGSGRLVESWRSNSTLVKLVNQVFSDKFEGEIDPLCITLKPHFNDTSISGSVLTHWHNQKTGRQEKVKSEALAWKVKELLESGIEVHSGRQDEPMTPIRPKDVAILCRKGDYVKQIVKALRKYGVPVSESEGNIMQRIEVQLVVTLLQFMQDPSNKLVIANLSRLLKGQTTTDILRSRIDYVLTSDYDKTGDLWMEDDEEIVRLKTLTGRFSNLSIPEMVKALIYECNLMAVVAKWGDSNIRKQNLSTVQHLAEDYDQRCLQLGLGSSISGFINYLNSTEPDKEKDNQSDTVKVFTYHGSKGLEWPVVILTELETDSLSTSSLINRQFMIVREVEINADEKNPFAKKYYLHYFPFILKTINSNPPQPMQDTISEMALFNQLKVRTKSEEKRLLYVGMTRAKDYLITTGTSDSFPWLTNIGVETTDRNHIWGIPSIENACQDITVPDVVPTLQNAEYTLIEKPKEHSEYGKRYLSPSKLETFAGYTQNTFWKSANREIDSKGWGDAYNVVGSCIHDIFAAYRPGASEHNHKAAVDIIGGYGLAKELSGHVDAILQQADWLYATLQTEFPQREGDKVERELPFMMTLTDGRTMRGEMDLLWHYTDDRGKHCVLVDYKTYHGVDLKQHTEEYYAQLSAYTAALKDDGYDVTHALVYYPVRGKLLRLE